MFYLGSLGNPVGEMHFGENCSLPGVHPEMLVWIGFVIGMNSWKGESLRRLLALLELVASIGGSSIFT